MNHNSLRLLIAAALAFAAPFGAHAVDGTNVNGVTWAHSYEGDVMPSANSPALTESGTFAGSTDGNILTITSGYAQLLGGVGNANWDGSSVTGSTFEVRMRVTSQTSTFGGFFEIGNQIGYAGLAVATNYVQVNGGGGNPIRFLDATAFHTYRMTITNNVVRFYIDGDTNYLGNFTLAGGAYNAFDFGYGTGSAAGASQYDYVRWTNEGAFPVPEPSVLWLAGPVLLLGLAERRRAV